MTTRPPPPRRLALLLLVAAGLVGGVGGAPARADGEATVRDLLDRAWAFEAQEVGDAADAVYAEAAEAAMRGGYRALERTALEGRFRCLLARARYLDLRRVAERLWSVCNELGDAPAATRAEADLGTINGWLGNHGKALYHLKRALAAFDAASDAAGAAQTRASLSRASAAQGELVEALVYGEAARAAFEAAKDDAGTADALSALGYAYAVLGAPEDALACYQKRLDLTPASDWQARAWVEGDIATVEAENDQLQEALDRVTGLLATFSEHDDVHGTLRALLLLAQIRVARGEPAPAITLATRARRMAGEADPVAALHALRLEAEAQLRAGLVRTASEGFEEVARQAAKSGWRPAEAEARRGLAECHLAEGRTAEALEQAGLAADAFEAALRGLGEELLVLARERHFRLFEVGLRAALASGDLDAVMEWMERSRSGALLASLGGRQALRAVGLPPELAARKETAEDEVVAAQLAYQAAATSGRVRELHGALDVLAAAQSRYEAVSAEIQEHARRIADLSHPVPATIEEIQASLQREEVFVSYAVTDQELRALVVPARGEARLVDLGPTPAVARLVRSLAPDPEDADLGAARGGEEGGDEEGEGGPGDEPEPAGPTEARLRALRAAVLDPLEIPADTKRLLVSPDGVLRRVPFPALLFEAPAGVEVAVVPSGSTWRLLTEQRARRGEHLLALGDPTYAWPADAAEIRVHNAGLPLARLPATRDEVLAVCREGDVPLLGDGASESALKARLLEHRRWRAIHLACHGRLDLERWTVCALALTPGGHDDGFLTALEIVGLEVRADLVVLSACSSGGGRIARGEGTVGLVRAFLGAGAPRVVASLWRVDDQQTQAFMVAFYDALRAGRSAARALRDAQAALRATEEGRDPRHWAPWVLWGLPGD